MVQTVVRLNTWGVVAKTVSQKVVGQKAQQVGHVASAAIGVEISDDLVDGFCRHCGHGGQIWLEATGYPADHDQILVVAARVVD